jgi:NAD(P)-dependent dehydrogenase (short-subunit alcohol dehydrogenase family)
MSIRDRVAIITGASSGIGRATALAFGREGYSVLAVGRQASALEAVAVEIQGAGGRAVALASDVTVAGAAERIVQRAVDVFGGIDVLVNAAGIIGGGTIETTTDEAWEAMLAINTTAPFRLLRAAVPQLVARGGAVVNVSSVTGLRSFPGVLAYCVSKAAVDHLTRCAALELAPKGVRVNTVNPGVVVSNLHRRGGMSEDQYAAFLDRSRETHPLGRPGRPEDIAELIVFLGTSRSGWMTGETIPIDGGRHLTCAR